MDKVGHVACASRSAWPRPPCRSDLPRKARGPNLTLNMYTNLQKNNKKWSCTTLLGGGGGQKSFTKDGPQIKNTSFELSCVSAILQVNLKTQLKFRHILKI